MISWVVTAQLISTFVLATQVVDPSTSSIQNLIPTATFCGGTAWLTCVIPVPKDRFFRYAAHTLKVKFNLKMNMIQEKSSHN